MDSFAFWTIVRLVVPLSIVRYPFWGFLLSAYIDVIDYPFLPLQTDTDITSYHIWDKILDTYYLALAAYTSLSWKDPIARKISITSFLYRAFGVLLFVLTQFRPLLFVFPNFFELYFLFYLIYRFFAKKDILFTSRKTEVIVILAILIPKLVQEYFMHVIKTTPTEIFSLDRTPFIDIFIPISFPQFLQILLLLLLPAITLFWLVSRQRETANTRI